LAAKTRLDPGNTSEVTSNGGETPKKGCIADGDMLIKTGVERGNPRFMLSSRVLPASSQIPTNPTLPSPLAWRYRRPI
jgi:hypothetical protein